MNSNLATAQRALDAVGKGAASPADAGREGNYSYDVTSSVAGAHSAAETMDAAEDWDWWAEITDEDLAYLTTNRPSPQACRWCGGRLRHNPLCDELRASWEPSMPFGKYAGMNVSKIPEDYLRWVIRNAKSINGELRDAIEARLQAIKS